MVRCSCISFCACCRFILSMRLLQSLAALPTCGPPLLIIFPFSLRFGGSSAVVIVGAAGVIDVMPVTPVITPYPPAPPMPVSPGVIGIPITPDTPGVLSPPGVAIVPDLVVALRRGGVLTLLFKCPTSSGDPQVL